MKKPKPSVLSSKAAVPWLRFRTYDTTQQKVEKRETVLPLGLDVAKAVRADDAEGNHKHIGLGVAQRPQAVVSGRPVPAGDGRDADDGGAVVEVAGREGDLFRLYVDDQLQAEASDTTALDPYTYGGVGVWTWETKASFDDLRVYGDAVPPQTTVVD